MGSPGKNGWNLKTVRDAKRNNWFTFCFLRNPYEKMLSSYNFYKNHTNVRDNNVKVKRGRPMAQEEIQNYKTFSDFILNLNVGKTVDKLHFQ